MDKIVMEGQLNECDKDLFADYAKFSILVINATSGKPDVQQKLEDHPNRGTGKNCSNDASQTTAIS